jgi:ubiquinone biosynthesis protein COQ4
MRRLGLMQELTKKANLDADSLRLISERKLLKNIELHELQKLPAGTLGRVYADHMIALNLSPEFYEVLQIDNDDSYIMMRMRQTHDLWHMITGFDTSIPGELGLQGFMMSQSHSPSSALLIGAHLSNS